MEEPDYTPYTLDDLYDVQRHIDRSRYPERAQRVDNEIARRVEAQQPQEDMTQDEEYLRLLSIFHFVVAGMTALFALFPIIHLAVGLAIVSGALQPTEGDEIPAFVGWVFVLFAGTAIVLGLAFAVLIALGGRALQRRQHYTFCLVVAGVACLIMPFGTVLGVFTIVVLMRDSVKEMFGRQVQSAGTAT